MNTLARSLSTRSAVIVGLSSMIGAGAFVSLGGAYAYAGPLLVVAIIVALIVAFSNAASTAQLSAQYPTSGGTYIFGREQLGHWWGFIAGWGFVTGKIASCAAMAGVIGSYGAQLLHQLLPGMVTAGSAHWWALGISLLAVLGVTAVNLVGITRTARAATILVSIAITALVATGIRLAMALATSVGESGAGVGVGTRSSSSDATLSEAGSHILAGGSAHGNVTTYSVLHAAAIMFFAFAGYARVATMGEEVRDPEKSIPRAIMVALGLVAGLYLALGLLLSGVLERFGGGVEAPQELVRAPFAYALNLVGAGTAWSLVLGVGAVCAATGALLALVTGISRTMLAMARHGDMPRALRHVDARRSVPRIAQIVAGALIAALVIVAPLLTAIEFSAFGVLVYYFVANAAAWTQRGEFRRWPRFIHVVGAFGCSALVTSLSAHVILEGVAVFAIGVVLRFIAKRSRA